VLNITTHTGTFSSVYKALDKYHHYFNNTQWCKDEAEQSDAAADDEGSDCDAASPTPVSFLGKRKQRGSQLWKKKRRLKTAHDRGPKVYVALKRIYVTSSPERIMNELEIMEALRYARNLFFSRVFIFNKN
jgi:cell division control protein 7